MILPGNKMTMFSSIFHSKTAPSADYENAAAIIEAFIDGKPGQWDWDDFTSIKKKDPFLESVRRRCNSVRDEYPPKQAVAYCDATGMEILRGLVRELRAKAVPARG
jgi:hypothetical protein